MSNIPYKTGGLPILAPDLTFPSSLGVNRGYIWVQNIDASGGLTTALSLTGKFSVDLLQFVNMTAENVTVKLTVDGVVVWNDTFTSGTQLRLFGYNASGGADTPSSMQCQNSLLLEIQTATDNNIELYYLARPTK